MFKLIMLIIIMFATGIIIGLYHATKKFNAVIDEHRFVINEYKEVLKDYKPKIENITIKTNDELEEE